MFASLSTSYGNSLAVSTSHIKRNHWISSKSIAHLLQHRSPDSSRFVKVGGAHNMRLDTGHITQDITAVERVQSQEL